MKPAQWRLVQSELSGPIRVQVKRFLRWQWATLQVNGEWFPVEFDDTPAAAAFARKYVTGAFPTTRWVVILESE